MVTIRYVMMMMNDNILGSNNSFDLILFSKFVVMS